MDRDIYTWLSKEASISTFKSGLTYILSQPVESLIILSCSANHYSENEINSLLVSLEIPVCGGRYPHIFLENELLETGVIFVGLPFKYSVELFLNLENNLEQLTSRIEKNVVLTGATSALMFYDGLMSHAELFIEELHSVLERNLTIAGGGAGDLDFVQRPCVYTNEGVKADAIQLVVVPQTLSIGIGHGWQILEGPFLVSESTGPNIESLNYQGAFSVYQETVEKLSDYKFSEHDFFDIAKHFPLGIESIQGELFVRDPIVVNKQSIQCVGNVPINSMIYILKGDKSQLIDSAAKATIAAKKACECSMTIVFDCISRKLYLEDDFEQELSLLTTDEKVKCTFGVLSLGEIANDKAGSIKLLNKSTVIGCL